MAEFFTEVAEPIRYAGPDSDDPLTFRWYDADRVVGERTMAEHLRIAVCYWHSFNWPGNDVFGDGGFDRPWLDAGLDPMDAARTKMAAAFEFFEKLDVPFFCFHDHDIAPEGSDFTEETANLGAMIDEAAAHMERTGCGCCGERPGCSGIPATWPARPPTRTRRCSPGPRPRSATAWRPPTGWAGPTTCCGADGRATTPCSTPTWTANSTSSVGS